MNTTQRTFLFASVKFFHAQLDIPRHSGCDLGDFCRMCRLDIMDQYKINSTELSQVYKYVKDNINDSNVYKSFRKEYMTNVN